jgi:PiT family inorganic phosphate transporter
MWHWQAGSSLNVHGRRVMFEIAVLTILLAFAFTFTNGFQDASSIAATFIASRSASPRSGILLVAGMSLLGAIFGGSAVVFTMAGLISLPHGMVELAVLFVALVTATAWNIITWKFGLPSSSTHSLIGGLVGGSIAAAGTSGVLWGFAELTAPEPELTGFMKIITFFVLSVLIGFAGSYVMHKTTSFLMRNAERQKNRKIVLLNWFAAALMAFFNGANDPQKQMGMIAMVLVAAGFAATPDVPLWARFACAILMALGTISGGWRIMNTLGRRIFRIEPVHSFDSQFFSASSIAISTVAGAPVSSTHVITMSILGVGAAGNPRKVQWGVGRDIILAMVITIPVTMLIAGLLYLIISPLAGV